MIIGLHGTKRSGKDTVFKLIKEEYPDAVRLAFADKIKESLAALLGISTREFALLKENATFKVEADGIQYWFNWRRFIQRYGTEAHRDIFGDDFWVDMILPRERDYTDRLYIVTDVRFENEAQRILDLGGKIIQINRVEYYDTTECHISEEVLPSKMIDQAINNNGTKDQLKERVLRVIENLT